MNYIKLGILVLKNWKYVVRFLGILEEGISKGINAADLQRGLNRLERGFKDVKSIPDAANAASNINDSFKL